MKRFILYSLSATVALAFGTAARADTYENSTEMDRDPTSGVISPDSDSPYNRAIPGSGIEADSMTDAERPNLTGGIISPDSSSPNNRVIPGIGAEYYSDSSEEDYSPTAGVISPDSDGPNNRAVPGASVDTSDAGNAYDEVYEGYRETTTSDVSDDAEATDDAPTEGIISPDSDSPYNRAVPQEGALESDDMMMDSEEATPTDGIISPDSDGPNNRVEVEDESMTVDEADDTNRYYDDSSEMEPTDGIISPDSDSPNNRAVPGTVR